MLNLIKNEFIKIGSKKIIWVAIAILVGIIGIMAYVSRGTDDEEEHFDNEVYKQWAESDLEWNKDDPVSTEYTKAMIKYEIYDTYYAGNDMSWRATALELAYHTYYTRIVYKDDWKLSEEELEENKKCFDELLPLIENSDEKGFIQFCIDHDYYEKAYQYALDHDLKLDDHDWHIAAIMEMQDYEKKLQEMEKNGFDTQSDAYQKINKQYLVLKYRVENDIQYTVMDAVANEDYSYMGSAAVYNFKSAFWKYMDESTEMLTFVSILLIIIAGGIISKEFSQGTIKFLLINPIKRGKIFWAKYITLLLSMIALSVLTFVLSLLGGMIFGIEGISASYLTYADGAVISFSVLPLIAKHYLYSLVTVTVFVTLAFALSSFSRNTALAIGASIGVLLGGSTVILILGNLGQDWARYLISANLDWYSFANGFGGMLSHVTFSGAIINVCLHMAVFLLIGYDAFTRKEVR